MLATSGVMVNIRKSSHHRHHINRSRSDITSYPFCIIMLLLLFNKIRVHSYHTVLCWFLVSSLAPLIADNDPVNDRYVGVTPLGSESGLTADDKRLGLHSRQQVGIRVSTSRQGLGLAPFARGRSTAARGAHATQKAVHMRSKPETGCPSQTGALFCSFRRAL